MKKTTRIINRAAVEKSLRDLETLFGKKPANTKSNALREQGAGTAGNSLREVQDEC